MKHIVKTTELYRRKNMRFNNIVFLISAIILIISTIITKLLPSITENNKIIIWSIWLISWIFVIITALYNFKLVLISNAICIGCLFVVWKNK